MDIPISTTHSIVFSQSECSSNHSFYLPQLTDNRLSKHEVDSFFAQKRLIEGYPLFKQSLKIIWLLTFPLLSMIIYPTLFGPNAEIITKTFFIIYFSTIILLCIVYLGHMTTKNHRIQNFIERQNRLIEERGLRWQRGIHNSVILNLEYKTPVQNPEETMIRFNYDSRLSRLTEVPQNLAQMTGGRIEPQELKEMFDELEIAFDNAEKNMIMIALQLLVMPLSIALWTSLVKDEYFQNVFSMLVMWAINYYCRVVLKDIVINYDYNAVFQSQFTQKNQEFLKRGIFFTVVHNRNLVKESNYCELQMWKMYKYCDIEENADSEEIEELLM